VDNVATFFRWMKLKVRFEVIDHSLCKMPQTNNHVSSSTLITNSTYSITIFTPSTVGSILRLCGLFHEPLLIETRVDSKSICFLTFPMAKGKAKALGWVPQESETVMFTIVQDFDFPESDDKEQGRLHLSYSLYLGPPLTGVSLLEVLQDPRRNAHYELDADQYALISQSLWLSVLPS